MESVQNQLRSLADKEYALFAAKLAPNIPTDRFLGVRVPVLRKFARTFSKSPDCKIFLNELPHCYYDENLLHSILLTFSDDYEQTLYEVERFLPYIDNWAVSDTLQPKVFRKHRKELLPKIKEWIASKHIYTCRFGVDMLMTHFLDEDFLPDYLRLPTAIKSEEYYVRMMIAWYYATALAKQWDSTIGILENRQLPEWIHRKTIQKAIESFRITKEQKDYLRSLR